MPNGHQSSTLRRLVWVRIALNTLDPNLVEVRFDWENSRPHFIGKALALELGLWRQGPGSSKWDRTSIDIGYFDTNFDYQDNIDERDRRIAAYLRRYPHKDPSHAHSVVEFGKGKK